nr:MAG TPA: hypothetical protein [Caudoviricetes sp.]
MSMKKSSRMYGQSLQHLWEVYRWIGTSEWICALLTVRFLKRRQKYPLGSLTPSVLMSRGFPLKQ